MSKEIPITVLVPTYRRPDDLERCLKALRSQTRPPDEVLVMVRNSDEATRSFLDRFTSASRSPVRMVTVTVPGAVAAYNAGLEAAQGEIIAITDDDAAPHEDWLARMEAHFQSDRRVGGVGGRDWVYVEDTLQDASLPPETSEKIGHLQWMGRLVGHHHLGTGGPREVDVLKGVNMSFRQTALDGLRFDERLRGTGAQVHLEISLCLAMKQRGWKLIYDPQVAVDHYPAPRFDEDQRVQFNFVAYCNKAHNETLSLLDHLPPVQRVAYLAWALLIGSRGQFGLAQCLRFLPDQGHLAGHKLLATLQGRWEGWRTWRQHRSA